MQFLAMLDMDSDQAVGALRTREAVMQRLTKDSTSDNATSHADVDERFSPTRVATSPTKQGHNPRFPLDLSSCDEEDSVYVQTRYRDLFGTTAQG